MSKWPRWKSKAERKAKRRPPFYWISKNDFHVKFGSRDWTEKKGRPRSSRSRCKTCSMVLRSLWCGAMFQCPPNTGGLILLWPTATIPNRKDPHTNARPRPGIGSSSGLVFYDVSGSTQVAVSIVHGKYPLVVIDLRAAREQVSFWHSSLLVGVVGVWVLRAYERDLEICGNLGWMGT